MKIIIIVIAGGMGARARDLFAMQGTEGITDAQCHEIGQMVQDDLFGGLQTGENIGIIKHEGFEITNPGFLTL